MRSTSILGANLTGIGRLFAVFRLFSFFFGFIRSHAQNTCVYFDKHRQTYSSTKRPFLEFPNRIPRKNRFKCPYSDTRIFLELNCLSSIYKPFQTKSPPLPAQRFGEACCHFAPPKGGLGVG